MTDVKLECIVVDDEPLAASLIGSYVDRTPFLNLHGVCHSAEEAFGIITSDEIDLMFLDIRMPGLSGMQLARVVPHHTKIIFTTAYSDHAVEGFRVNALDYLLKPVSYEEFLEAALKARELFNTRNITTEEAIPATRTHILVKSEYRLLRLNLDDIIYIEGLKDYVKIYLESEKNPVLSLMNIKNLENDLPDTFMRIHRSFIVNVDKVKIIERNCVHLGDRAIPISESNRALFFRKIQY